MRHDYSVRFDVQIQWFGGALVRYIERTTHRNQLDGVSISVIKAGEKDNNNKQTIERMNIEYLFRHWRFVLEWMRTVE